MTPTAWISTSASTRSSPSRCCVLDASLVESGWEVVCDHDVAVDVVGDVEGHAEQGLVVADGANARHADAGAARSARCRSRLLARRRAPTVAAADAAGGAERSERRLAR